MYITCNGKAIDSSTTFRRNKITENDNIQLYCKLLGGS